MINPAHARIASGRVTRFYRAPFLKDDRLLDMIGASAAKIFLLRPPPGAPLEPFENGFRRRVGEVTFFYGGPGLHLRWLQGERFPMWKR